MSRATIGFAAALAGFLLFEPALAGRDEKLLVGSYRLVKRVSASGGGEVRPPDALGFLTFTDTHRTVIMKWKAADGSPVSIAVIAKYTLSGGKYCETEEYGVQSNLGSPGVDYDPPQDSPKCTPAVSDASGLAFEIPGETLRFRVTRDGIVTTTSRWTDTWEKSK